MIYSLYSWAIAENVKMENTIDNKENESKNNNAKNGSLKKDSKDKEWHLDRKVSFIRESVSDSGVPERRPSAAADAGKRSSLRSHELESDALVGQGAVESSKVPRKFVSTWRQACDRTKDRTRELLKRWRTLPEGNAEMAAACLIPPATDAAPNNAHNWSVHVWASYIKRYPSEDENLTLLDNETPQVTNNLSSTQKEKLGHFFSHVLDNDHDDLISEQDFEHFSERLRRFADWSPNSPEFVIMTQVQQGFMDTFLKDSSCGTDETSSRSVKWKLYVSLEDWLQRWSELITGARNLQDCPVWLQYLPKLLFQSINTSGSGKISRDELGSFYSSVLGFSTQRVGEIIDEAFGSLTSNKDHPISYGVYRLAFVNFLLGRFPNGPGQFVFGCVPLAPRPFFPIDYSALNSQPADREPYTPDKRSNRTSVVI